MKRAKLLLPFVLAFVVLGMGLIWGAKQTQAQELTMEDKIASITYMQEGALEPMAIHPVQVGTQWYLFLPASADLKQLRVSGSTELSLAGEIGPSVELAGETAYITLDLSQMTTSLTEEQTQLRLGISDATAGISQPLLVMRSSKLETMYVTLTDGAEEPNAVELSWIHQGNSLEKGNTAKGGELILTSADGQVETQVGLDSFKGRGNSSWDYAGDKKGYNFKLQDKKELIEGAGQAKSWCLLSGGYEVNLKGFIDRTHLSNLVAMTLYQNIAGESALMAKPVDLYINHDYRGTYLLTEKVQINKERVNISESEYKEKDGGLEDKKGHTLVTDDPTDPALAAGIRAYQYATNSVASHKGGYLLEIDFRYKYETSYFITRQGATIVLKEPEYAAKEQVQQIAIYVQAFEDALYSPTGYNQQGQHYSELMDLDSLAKKFALDCLSAQVDAMDASSYYYVDLDEEGQIAGPLLAGPAWDYDYVDTDTTGLYSPNTSQLEGRKVWIEQLLTKGDFMNCLTELSEQVVRPLWQKLNETGISENISLLADSQAMNFARYEKFKQSKDYLVLAEQYKSFMNARFTAWYETIWENTQLTGVSISETEDGLKATIHGTPTTMRWVYITEEHALQVPIVGAVGPELTELMCGEYTYQLVVQGSFNGEFRTMYSNPITVTLAHAYDRPSFHWNEKHACHVEMTCTKCQAVHKESVVVTTKVEEPTYAKDGITTYTACYAWNGQNLTDTRSTTQPALILERCKAPEVENATNGLTLMWEAVEGATGYQIYRDGEWLADTKKLTYLDKGVTSGAIHSYSLKAYLSANGSKIVGKQSGKTKGCYVATPTISKVARTTSGVKVTFKKVNKATGYILYRGKNGGKLQAIAALTANQTSYTDASLTAVGTYQYQLVAYTKHGQTTYSSAGSKNKSVVYVPDVTITKLTAPSSTKLQASWKKIAKVSGYQLRYTANGKSKTITIKNAKTATITLSKLKKKTKYTIALRAYVTMNGVNTYSPWVKKTVTTLA